MAGAAHDHAPVAQTEDAVRRAAGAGPEAEAVPPIGGSTLQAVLMRHADAGTRQRMVGGLQSRIGNAGVTEFLGGPPVRQRAPDPGSLDGPLPIQRQDPSSSLFGDEPVGLEAPGTIPTSKTDHKVANAGYAVSGTLEAVANALAAKTEAGSVATGFSSINLTTKDEVVVAAVLEVTSTVTLPTWSDRGKAPAEEQKEWDRFAAAIAAHEAQHLAIDKKEFAGAHGKTLRLSETKADEALDKIQTDATTKNDEFDTNTDHGKNAGTTINPWIGKTIKVP